MWTQRTHTLGVWDCFSRAMKMYLKFEEAMGNEFDIPINVALLRWEFFISLDK